MVAVRVLRERTALCRKMMKDAETRRATRKERFRLPFPRNFVSVRTALETRAFLARRLSRCLPEWT